jgi:hypothetical protein
VSLSSKTHFERGDGSEAQCSARPTPVCSPFRRSGTLALLLPMSLDWFIGPFLGSDRQVVAGYTGYTTSDCRQRTWSIPQPSAATAPHLRPFSTSYRFLLQFILFHLHHFIFRVCTCWVWSGRCMIVTWAMRPSSGLSKDTHNPTGLHFDFSCACRYRRLPGFAPPPGGLFRGA